MRKPSSRIPPGKAPRASAKTFPVRSSLLDFRKEIQELIDLLNESNLAELEVERNGLRIRVRRERGIVPVVTEERERPPAGRELPAERTQPPLPSERSGLVTITSPIVGTFYRSPSPDADPYVEEGDLVRKGQVLCLVEAMKLMNEIESEADGRVVKILVESTKPVEYGQPLFLIDPASAA